MMQKKYEVNTGICEKCGNVHHPENLYVDIYEHMYTLVCPKCFYKRNQDKDLKYLSRVQEVLPDVITPDKFSGIKNKKIAIGNTYPYLKADGIPFSRTEKASLVDQSLKHFFSLDKIKNKFTTEVAKAKVSGQKSNVGHIFLVAIVGKVCFKSYLEYLEHELYKQFRKDCPIILR